MLAPARHRLAPADVDITIPVHNQERGLAPVVRRLHAYVMSEFPFSARITIVDNASTDTTWAVALRLARELPDVRLVRLNETGRGRALAAAWLTSDSRVVAYMDPDLSIHLSGLAPLVAPIMSGHSDISIGSRLAPGAHARRSSKDQLIRRGYNLLLRAVLGVRFKDTRCGFKALRADVARRLVPAVGNRKLFFDTELLVQAARSGFRVHEIAVDRVEGAASRFDVVPTAIDDLLGVARLAVRRWMEVAPGGRRGQLARFAAIGLLCTLAYAAIYWTLRGLLQPWASNGLAMFITAVANTAANRRLTFGVRGGHGLLRDHTGGLVAFAVGLLLTSAAVFAMQLPRPAPPVAVEIAILTVANALATTVRFVIFRRLLLTVRAPEKSALASCPAPGPSSL